MTEHGFDIFSAAWQVGCVLFIALITGRIILFILGLLVTFGLVFLL